MRIGFTGTRNGMTPQQRASVANVLATHRGGFEFHHGDCVGADDEAANIVAGLACNPRVVCHPPADAKLRAYNPHYDEICDPKTHFARNRDIVDVSDVLIACPPYPPPITPETRGGTAYTVNYARKHGRPVVIVWPDGLIDSDAPLFPG